MDWLRDWWAVICGFVGTIFWLARIEQILQQQRADPPMTLKLCEQCRAGCQNANSINFKAGTKEFAEIKLMLAKVEESGQRRHDELIKMIISGTRRNDGRYTTD